MKKDIEEILIKRGIWGTEKENEVKKLQEQLKAQRVVLSKTTRVPANRERVKNIIKGLEEVRDKSRVDEKIKINKLIVELESEITFLEDIKENDEAVLNTL